ncbi:MAG: 4-hydroxybutyryl-CoA dehydratase, partial [Deltaproteobacteria bacterium]|nr:4-hydroxybutyryl-CoA dehydratase [Deltaproteobacteria bacterium]
VSARVRIMGEDVSPAQSHPLAAPSARAAAATYDMACDPAFSGLFTATSFLTGKTVNRFTHLHASAADLVDKVAMQRACGRKTGCCFQRCVGMDAANAVFSTTYEIDEARGTSYHQRFRAFWAEVQEKDLMVDGAMTDPKGDRGKRPGEQDDPDLYVRVAGRKDGGIVVRGAKLHQTGMVNSHWMIVMPTMSMRPGEEEYAVCFALPVNAPGVLHFYGRQASDTRRLETRPADCGNPVFGGQEIMTVFEDVFVPEQHVFLDGEVEFSGTLVERFAGYHRQSYGGCKTGVGDLLIGAAALIAEMNGVARASHIRDKLVEMVHLNETLYACGVACSAAGKPRPAGNWEIDQLLANVCKQNVTRFPYEIARLATDIAGGLLGTLPPASDLDDPVAGPYLRKYLAGAAGAEDRIKVLRLIENLVAGSGAVGYLIESMHGAGPPQAQRVMIARQADLEAKTALVKSLLGISGKSRPGR